jgi:hypothetical protein
VLLLLPVLVLLHALRLPLNCSVALRLTTTHGYSRTGRNPVVRGRPFLHWGGPTMNRRTAWIGLAALAAGLAACGTAHAAVARFHYVPPPNGGNVLVPTLSPCGTSGEKFSWFGSVRQPCCTPPRPTCTVTFPHPCTGRCVVVPLALPRGTPIIEHRGASRVIYNYGSYTVEIQFLGDGSVDVIYNSGFLRDL